MSSSRKESPPIEVNERSALVDELQYLGEMSSTEAALFHHHAAAANGLGITDLKTVSTLMHEGSMTAGEIAKRLGLTTGAVTNVADPKDRRKVIVEADLPSLEKMSHVYDSVADAFQKLHEQYSVAELHFLIDYFKQSIATTKIEISKLVTSDE